MLTQDPASTANSNGRRTFKRRMMFGRSRHSKERAMLLQPRETLAHDARSLASRRRMMISRISGIASAFGPRNGNLSKRLDSQ